MILNNSANNITIIYDSISNNHIIIHNIISHMCT